MAKVRVHELAKQLGMESKVVLVKLQEMGEFVRSASSTVEAPVVRKMLELFPNAKPVEEKKPVKKTAAKKVAAKPAQNALTSEAATELLAEIAPDLAEQATAQKVAAEARPIAPVTPTAPSGDAAPTPRPAMPRPAAPRPGNNPFGTPRPAAPRPGNNPFSGGASMPRPPQRPA